MAGGRIEIPASGAAVERCRRCDVCFVCADRGHASCHVARRFWVTADEALLETVSEVFVCASVSRAGMGASIFTLAPRDAASASGAVWKNRRNETGGGGLW
ncbi:unnamed protein product [Lampetra fluviatilis]